MSAKKVYESYLGFATFHPKRTGPNTVEMRQVEDWIMDLKETSTFSKSYNFRFQVITIESGHNDDSCQNCFTVHVMKTMTIMTKTSFMPPPTKPKLECMIEYDWGLVVVT